MMIGKLNDIIEINFPLNKKYIIFTGDNPCLKTKVLETLNSFLIEQGANTIYFPWDRTMNVNKDEIEAINMSFSLSRNINMRENIEFAYDMRDPFKFEEIEKGGKIDCGYLQIINFFYTIFVNPYKNLNIIIDNLHCNLHYLVQDKLIKDIMAYSRIDRLIFSVFDTTPFNGTLVNSDLQVIDINEVLKWKK